MVAGLIDGWQTVLGDLSEAQLMAGLSRCCEAGGEHPPNAGAFRKACLGRDSQAIEAKALEAWNWCERHANLETNPRDAEDPLVLVAIGAIGGWRQFCCEPINEWQQRNFLKAYCEAASNPQVEEVAQLSFNGQPLGARRRYSQDDGASSHHNGG